jgi:hypothetical protein
LSALAPFRQEEARMKKSRFTEEQVAYALLGLGIAGLAASTWRKWTNPTTVAGAMRSTR